MACLCGWQCCLVSLLCHERGWTLLILAIPWQSEFLLTKIGTKFIILRLRVRTGAWNPGAWITMLCFQGLKSAGILVIVLESAWHYNSMSFTKLWSDWIVCLLQGEIKSVREPYVETFSPGLRWASLLLSATCRSVCDSTPPPSKRDSRRWQNVERL